MFDLPSSVVLRAQEQCTSSFGPVHKFVFEEVSGRQISVYLARETPSQAEIDDISRMLHVWAEN